MKRFQAVLSGFWPFPRVWAHLGLFGGLLRLNQAVLRGMGSFLRGLGLSVPILGVSETNSGYFGGF